MRLTPHSCSWRGLEIPNAEIDDKLSRVQARHEFPGVGGARIEDLGKAPEEITVKANFFGEDYPGRFVEFLTRANDGEAGELVHPIHGPMGEFAVQSVDVHHPPDEQDLAAVTIVFLRSSVRSAPMEAPAIADAARDDEVRRSAAADIDREMGRRDPDLFGPLRDCLRALHRVLMELGIADVRPVSPDMLTGAAMAAAIAAGMKRGEESLTGSDPAVVANGLYGLCDRVIEGFFTATGIGFEWLGRVVSVGVERVTDLRLRSATVSFAGIIASLAAELSTWTIRLLNEPGALARPDDQDAVFAQVDTALQWAVGVQDIAHPAHTETASALLRLTADVRNARRAARAAFPAGVEVTLDRSIPLVLAVYERTGDAAQTAEVALGSGVRNRLLVPEGTVLRMPR
jgi:hypothetical protein